jgi:hypothetical protein
MAWFEGGRQKPAFRPCAEVLETRLALSGLVEGAAPDSALLSADAAVLSTTDGETPTDGGSQQLSNESDNTIDAVAYMNMAGAGSQRENQDFNRNHSDDATPLHVVSSSILTRGQQVVGFTVRFNESLAAGPAQDARNYRAFEVSKPDKFLSQLLYQDSNLKKAVLPIRTAKYQADENTVILLLQSPRKISKHYQIGLANPQERQRVGRKEAPLVTLTDVDGHPLSVPTTRRGQLKRGPITFKPDSRIALDTKLPSSITPS